MEDVVKCPVCLETFDDPRVLPCQHSFCKKCITGIAKARRGLVVCPQCRKETWLPRKGVQGYPANIFIKNVIDLLNNGALIKQNANCSSCASNARATHQCIYCGDPLCLECAKTHGQRLGDVSEEIRRRHQVVEIPYGLDGVKRERYNQCNKHQEEDLKYYCDKCQRKVCRDCTVLMHRDHNVQLLKDAAKEYRSAAKSLIAEARERFATLDPLLDKITENTNSIETSSQHCFTAIKEAKQRCLQELSSHLDAREKQLLLQLHVLLKKEELYLQQDQEKIQNYVSKLEKLSTEIEEKVDKMGLENFIETKWKLNTAMAQLRSALDERTKRNTNNEVEGNMELDFMEAEGHNEVMRKEIQKSMGAMRVVRRHGDHCVQIKCPRRPPSAAEAPTNPCKHDRTASSPTATQIATGTGNTNSPSLSIRNTPQGSQGQQNQSSQTTTSPGRNASRTADTRRMRRSCFVCGRTNHMARNCHARFDIQGRRVHPGDTCFRCGEEGHWAEDCGDTSSGSECSWYSVEEDSDSELDEGVFGNNCCTRCGRSSHDVSHCYAQFSVDGRRL